MDTRHGQIDLGQLGAIGKSLIRYDKTFGTAVRKRDFFEVGTSVERERTDFRHVFAYGDFRESRLLSKHLFADCRNRFRRGVSALLGGGIENDSGNLNVVNDVVNCRIIRIAFGNDNARQLDSENSADVGNVDIF